MSKQTSREKPGVPSGSFIIEITDLNNMYLKEGRMSVVPMGRGIAWLDAGTPDSLCDASRFMQVIEKRQGLKIACIEEIAYKMGFIDDTQMERLIDGMKKGLERLAAAGVVNYSLSNLDALVEGAAEDGYIAPEWKERILKFRDNPSDESWIKTL